MKNSKNNDSVNNDNFWIKLSTPITGLSPMDGVTDQPYRYIQKKYGKPSVIYTEFTNVEDNIYFKNCVFNHYDFSIKNDII